MQPTGIALCIQCSNFLVPIGCLTSAVCVFAKRIVFDYSFPKSRLSECKQSHTLFQLSLKHWRPLTEIESYISQTILRTVYQCKEYSQNHFASGWPALFPG